MMIGCSVFFPYTQQTAQSIRGRQKGAFIFIYVTVMEIIYNLYIYKNGCMYVCMFRHHSGTTGAISIKLGAHMTYNLDSAPWRLDHP